MQVFKLNIAYDEEGNSPWDALWYDGDEEDIEVLDCQMRLGAVWKSPQIRFEKRDQTPDVYGFQTYFAVSERIRDRLLPIVEEAVEFLPLSVDAVTPLFALHPLFRADLDERAIVSKNSVSGNISVIRSYSFNPEELQDAIPIFQVRQPNGSKARNAGYPCSGVLVSQDVVEVFEQSGVLGVVCDLVWCPSPTSLDNRTE